MSEDLFTGVHEVGVHLPSHAEVEAGLVLKWRRRGNTWEGLVARETAAGTLLTEWLPALVLTPLETTATDDPTP